MGCRCGVALKWLLTRPWCHQCAATEPQGPAPTDVPASPVNLLYIRDKRERKYRELVRARRCRLQVLAIEVGGRWDDSALTFLRRLAGARARAAPAWLRQSTAQAYAYRWSALLSVAAQRAFAASLLHLPIEAEACDGEVPAVSDVVADARFLPAQEPSRMPPTA